MVLNAAAAAAAAAAAGAAADDDDDDDVAISCRESRPEPMLLSSRP